MRRVALWLLVLGAGIALLYGRFDWSAGEGRFAERGFVLSAYLLLIVIPTVFYLARRLLRSTRAAMIVTFALLFVTILPYEWLGLDQYYFYETRPQVFPIDEVRSPSLEFLPSGTLRAFPYDYLFWPLLLAAGLAGIWGVWWLRNRSVTEKSHRIPILLSAAFAAICLQALAHTGMRAPYTYLAYFQRPQAEEHWYHVYHFADGSGASQGDQFVFSPLEDYFQGAGRDGDNQLIRRPVSFYLAAQGRYFVKHLLRLARAQLPLLACRCGRDWQAGGASPWRRW